LASRHTNCETMCHTWRASYTETHRHAIIIL